MEKENNVWLIPFSREEVKAWDKIVSYNKDFDEIHIIYEVIKKSVSGNILRLIESSKNLNIFWIQYIAYYYTQYREYYITNSKVEYELSKLYIDRRPRYKIILNYLLWLTPKSER